MAPQTLACLLQSLPPILHIIYSESIRSYSKGSQGLFVPLRVIGIFTDTTISPSSWLRQCPDRYTIRAGRNLPDKEFRYLRDRYSYGRRFTGASVNASELLKSTFLNLPAPGRCQTLYSIFRFSRVLCFDKQSPGPLHCGQHYCWRLFFRSYETILPSSLATTHSSTFRILSSTTCVGFGTGCINRFSWKRVLRDYQRIRRLCCTIVTSQLLQRTIPSVRT